MTDPAEFFNVHLHPMDDPVSVYRRKWTCCKAVNAICQSVAGVLA